MDPLCFSSPLKLDLTTEGIQFSCGRLISCVSSTLTIFISGFMNMDKQFSMVVFPEATPPATSTDARFSMRYHRYAAISELIVLKAIRSEMVNGSTLKRLMVKVEPLRVISRP